jgi:hypothetical protein
VGLWYITFNPTRAQLCTTAKEKQIQMDKTASQEAITASLEGGEDAVLDAKVARVYR